ncbi:MAG: TonB-dependent receptor [Flavobacteriales bacterium]|jgi:ferric enterobactin receptor|nr:TonB-dependent receptor [Flavobacteriales bacterium]
MKKILIILLLIPLLSTAQRGSNKGGYSGDYSNYSKKNKSSYFRGSVSGKISDSETGRGLEFANISITNAKWNKIIEGTMSGPNGKFSMTGILTGDYILSINYLGYKKQEIEFKLTKKNPDINLKDIKLEINSEMLSEIIIDEQKPIYESKIDKIIYNAENDDNGANEDATDVLRKAPLLSVDFDGNVELRGSKQIKFLLNGKASSFLSGDLASALQMIPADEIKSVEIITSPGAKYDGEGEAGIVNIVTQKKKIDGYKASLDGSVGTRNNKNGFNLTLGKGRFSLSARGNAWYSWPREGSNTYERQDWNSIGDTNILTNDGTSESQWIGWGSGINMYYDINAYNSISSDINFRGRNTPSKNTTTLDYNGTDTSYNYNSYLESTNERNNISWNTDYTRSFEDNEDREFSLSYQLGNRTKKNITEISENDSLINLTNINNEQNFEHTFQLDYSHPINDHLIEVGAKMIIRDQEMDYQTDSDSNAFIFPNEIFNYTQTVNAFYLSSNLQFTNDYSLQLGTRYELTNIKGDWKKNSHEKFSKNYDNILPNLTFSKKLDMGKSLKLSFSSRISRPSSSYINTNTNITDNKNITVGNPNLTPSTTNQVEFGYNSFGKKYQGSYYVYYRQNNNLIESFLRIQNDTSITTYQNIGSSKKYGANYYGSIKFNKLTLRSGFNLYYYQAEDRILSSEDRSALLYNYNFGISLKMKNNWKAEGFGFMRSPSQTLQGSSTSFSMMSFGIKKEFKNKRGSIGIRIVEPFAKNGNKIFTTELSGNNFNQITERKILFTSIGISFKYTFGKLNFKSNKQRSKIKNDDVSEESNTEF